MKILVLIFWCCLSISLAEEKPNILLIYVDDMGYGDLGCYGAEDPGIKTPNIDQLAAEGIRFTNYLSASSVCSPSRGALLTGRYPQRNGLPVCPNDSPHYKFRNEHVGLPLSEITIAELLKNKGYATAAFGKWHLGNMEKFGPLKQGFNEYVGRLYNFHIGQKGKWYNGETLQDSILFKEAHQRLTDATIEFMKRKTKEEKPFFIFLSHYLVHGPWSPNKEFCTPEEWASVKKLKGGMNPKALAPMVRELDHHVGLIMGSIKELGIDEKTMIIFASDNGPWLPAGSSGPFAEGKFSTREGGQRVPAMIRWPGKITTGKVSDEMVSTMDIFPTIATIAGATLPSDRIIDGYDLMPLLSGETAKSPRDSFAYYNGVTLEAVRIGPWKLHLPRKSENLVYWATNQRWIKFRNLQKPFLINLDDDPAGEKNLVKDYPEKVKELQNFAAKMRVKLGDWNLEGRESLKSTLPWSLNRLRPANSEENKKYK